MQHFLEKLDDEDLLKNPILSKDNRIPNFRVKITDENSDFFINISSDEIRKIDPQFNSFPARELDFKKKINDLNKALQDTKAKGKST